MVLASKKVENHCFTRLSFLRKFLVVSIARAFTRRALFLSELLAERNKKLADVFTRCSSSNISATLRTYRIDFVTI